MTSTENTTNSSELHKVLECLASVYFSVHEIDLVADTVKEYNADNIIGGVVKEGEFAARKMKTVMRYTIADSHLEQALEFSDLTTIAQRLKGKRLLSAEFVGVHVGWIKEQFIPLECDEDGTPIKVIHTVEAIDEQKKKEESLVNMALIDEMTKLYNRKAYEDHLLEHGEYPKEENFVFMACDVNGLKVVNDTLGHEAGDELIAGAADCLRNAIGPSGRVYRVGGDEFAAILFAGPNLLEGIKRDIQERVDAWKGTLVDELAVSCGFASKAEFKDEPIAGLSRIADQRMYEAKEAYYKNKGIDRKGRKAAYDAICAAYTKILKVNLTLDSYDILQMEESEKLLDQGFRESISQWLKEFAHAGNVHEDDLAEYLRRTDIEYLRDYFKSGNPVYVLQYKRRTNDKFVHVSMEMLPCEDYADDNQTVFLYVKNIRAASKQ